MRILTTIETIWFNAVLLASPNWTFQISCDVVASLIYALSVLVVLISFDIRLIKSGSCAY